MNSWFASDSTGTIFNYLYFFTTFSYMQCHRACVCKCNRISIGAPCGTVGRHRTTAYDWTRSSGSL